MRLRERNRSLHRRKVRLGFVCCCCLKRDLFVRYELGHKWLARPLQYCQCTSAKQQITVLVRAKVLPCLPRNISYPAICLFVVGFAAALAWLWLFGFKSEIILLLLVRTTYIYIWLLFFAHIPFVVNRAFNTASTERLQHCYFAQPYRKVCDWFHSTYQHPSRLKINDLG